MNHVYLSRRNLLSLLNKMDRTLNGDTSNCTIIKYKNDGDPCQQTMDTLIVTGVEDDVFYANRPAGIMHEKDDPSSMDPQDKVRPHTTGLGIHDPLDMQPDPKWRKKLLDKLNR